MKMLRSGLSVILALCMMLAMTGALADQTLEGDANVDQRNYPSTAPFIHPPFYNVKLAVDVDDQGVITAVRDNGTGTEGSVQAGNEEFWANKNKPYFDVAVNAGLLDRFVGKTLEEVKAMDMGGADAVSGATMVSEAAQEAVVNALEGRKGKTFLDVEGQALTVESVEGNTITLASQLPADFDLQLLDIRWSVYNDEVVPADSYTAEIADQKLVIRFNDLSAMKPGYYCVNVVDASGTYRSPAFEGGPAAAQAPYFVLDSGLTAEDISFDGKAVVLASGSIADYVRNIQHVQILAEGAEKPTEQEPVGHHGTVGNFIAMDEQGVLNADGIVKARNGDENPLFEEGVAYTVTIAAFGYPELTFPYVKGAQDAETAEGTAEAAALLEAVRGTYVPLFPVITDAQYDQLWLDPCVAAMGEEAGPAIAELLKAACNGTIYGAEAVEAFGANPESAQFDCLFVNGVAQITFDGNMISGTDEQGQTVFSHEYAYVSPLSLAGMTNGYLYETTDADAGEFRYFFMMPDTPESTYHLEFRYGSDVEALTQYAEGPYAYWLAAGFPADADAQMIENVITLFCEENLAAAAAE